MARQPRTGKFSSGILFILISSCLRVHAIEELLGHCGLTIDLMTTQNIYSGILTMPLPQTMSRYQDPARPVNCDVIISFPSGANLLIELYFLDIMPRSGDPKTCTTGLEIFDQTGKKYYGSRICMEGWQWEERHRESRQEKVLVLNSPLTFRLVSSGPYRGLGFKLHFNQIRPNWPCFIQEFKCRQIQRCINDRLACDGWNDCGDYSDERIEAGCNLLSASEICSIIIGILLVIGIATEILVFVMTYRKYSQQYGLKSESKVPIASDNNNMDAVFGIAHRYSSQDSLPSRHSKSSAPARRRQESESDTVDKVDLEKADRHSNKVDDVLERSFRSNPRKSRSQSQGTEVSLEPVKKTGHYYSKHKGHSSSKTSLNHDRMEPLSGTDNPALESENNKVQSRSKERLPSKDRDRQSLERDKRCDRDLQGYSDSDCSYGDRDKYKSPRRRSSENRRRELDYRRNSRHSDDDSEYDQDREKRRRRRYDSYSDDSDYEYERERRKRSRERYNLKKSDDFSESDRDRYTEDDDKDAGNRHRGDNYKRDQYRDSHENKSGRKSSYDSNDEDDWAFHQRRSSERRYSPSADQDRYTPSKNVKRRSRSPENVEQRKNYRESPPLPLPPPYSEEDTQSIEELPPPVKDVRNVNQNNKTSAAEKDVNSMNEQNKTSPLSNEKQANIQQEKIKQHMKELDENDWRRTTQDRRERYSKNRWESPKGYQDSPPPRYKDIASKPAFTGITYKEDSV